MAGRDADIQRFLNGDWGAFGLAEPSGPMPNLSDFDLKKFISGDLGAFGLPKPSSMPSPAEVRKEAKERSTAVLSHWNRLRQILERHEEVIRKRWMKKSKVHRSRIILQAWPGLSATHRPDFQAWIKEGSQVKTKGTRFREAYLWPYLNVEDLVRGKTFLLLINSRGRHPPRVFAHSDFYSTHLGNISGAIMPAFLNVYSMLLEGEKVETYGRLVSWGEDEGAMMNTMAGLAHLPGPGLWILEIQQRLLHFLVQCCEALLHDIDAGSLISEASIKPEPPLLKENSEWSTIASVAAEAPYRLPSQLNFNRLKDIVQARRMSAEDYIRDLREDPGYFADVLGDWSEHRQEILLDTLGNRHPTLDRPLFWEYVIGSVVADAYGALIVWEDIGEQLTRLASLQSKYASEITPKKQLPSEYMRALLTLRYSLSQMQKVPIRNLQMAVPASPPYRSKFVRDPQVPGSTMIHARSKVGEDQMMWLLSSLWDDQQLNLLTLPALVDEIEGRIERDPNEKAKFSALVTRIFSDLGLIARIHHELDIYLPWAAGYEFELVNYKDQIEKEFQQRSRLVDGVSPNIKGISLAKIGCPADGRFYYPSDKRRSKKNTESMRKAEHNLDEFWEKVDGVYRKNTGVTLTQAVQHICTAARPLERTPEWVEPIKEPKKKPPPKNGHEELSPVPRFDSDENTKFIAPQPKSKPKTRGTANPTDPPPPAPSAPPVVASTPDPQPTFKLKARALKVFKVLFWQPSLNDLPGEVSWADFLYAMTSTGFAAEKQYGSVWQFTPTTLDVEQSIQFHEPHPSGKIAFHTARRIGRRLTRSYGWFGGMFTLE
ncbi:hypothetical protein DSL72_003762 [Monilinia vaccinii-corymbosi]|uniref:Clr5 domain-containing protein n=1 Tax=Monilinia vaccinii-corymbosi TaxID=61207 RepID=A0A8A3NYS6_9HELO|nr:hypothetical protein DSL72_003762 [Monilinia vaccinii-corymbosi]